MRRRILLITIAGALLAGHGMAQADPIQQYDSGYSEQQTCLSWYDFEGTEQGSISVCGRVDDFGYGEYRWVEAQRHVQTCDVDGNQCNDAYSERYAGPADASEFTMDVVAGTATFNIVLAGETAADECVVQATAQAEGTYTYADPYPNAYVRGDPSFPYVWVQQGNTSVSVIAAPGYGYADVTQHDSENTSRYANGSGSVCGWVANQTADYGAMWSRTNASTTYSVRAPSFP